jgi:anti-sigma factor RsiW
MNRDLLNILSNSNKDIDNQKLMDYLAGKLSAEESHEVEKMMADSAFMNDALEGLAGMNNKKDIGVLVEQLNAELQKKLAQKKERKQRRKLQEYPWVYFAVILILVLLVIAYIIIRKFPPAY